MCLSLHTLSSPSLSLYNRISNRNWIRRGKTIKISNNIKKNNFSHTEQHIIKKIKKKYLFLTTKLCDVHSILLISYLEEIRHNHSHGAEESFQIIWQFCATRVSRIPISGGKNEEKKRVKYACMNRRRKEINIHQD